MSRSASLMTSANYIMARLAVIMHDPRYIYIGASTRAVVCYCEDKRYTRTRAIETALEVRCKDTSIGCVLYLCAMILLLWMRACVMCNRTSSASVY